MNGFGDLTNQIPKKGWGIEVNVCLTKQLKHVCWMKLGECITSNGRRHTNFNRKKRESKRTLKENTDNIDRIFETSKKNKAPIFLDC